MADQSTTFVTTARGALPEGRWRVDPAHSAVTFKTRAMMGLMGVKGRFGTFDGALVSGPGGEVTGQLRLDVSTLATGIAKRDTHLKTADFFDAENHPHAHFTLSAVRSADGRLVATGSLRIRDRDIPVEAPLDVEHAGDDLRLRARFPVDHDAAGLGWAKPGMVRKVIEADLDLRLAADGG